MSYPIMKNIIHELFDFIQNIENNSLHIDVDVLTHVSVIICIDKKIYSIS